MNFIFRQINLNSNFNKTKQPSCSTFRYKSTWSVNGVNSSPAVCTASQRLTYCFRCGRKEKRESHLRDLVIKRALKVRSAQSERTKRQTAQLFTSFFQAATPFISLKMRRRRRGKQTISKLFPLDRVRSERKSFGALSTRLYTSGRSSKPFMHRLEFELESLSSSSVSRNRNSSVGGTPSIVREKRDQIHRTAFTSRPYRWKKLSRKGKEKEE